MSKKLCKEKSDSDNKEKKLKYECKKCGQKSHKEDNCCKPVKIIKAA